ncbi:MAG TPA: discoidin domain-containing protein [Asticcacaulis sp.]|nr:discoidin domain-containing protein [Asticcacaulis sp.]
MKSFAVSVVALSLAVSAQAGDIVIDTRHPIQTFRPDEAFGAALDGMGKDEVAQLYTPHNVAAMTKAGLKPVTYRLRTELGIEAWHWNEQGTWSDPAHQQGYWTSSDHSGKPILMTHGYALPRRGDTVDNANELSWSMLDDGDEGTFWKTNPYLDKTYTHLDSNRPQWAIVDLGADTTVDAAKIVWAEPYAVTYAVQYWVGIDQYDPAGKWVDFSGGRVTDGKGGTAVLKLTPAKTHYVRLKLEQGSGTAPEVSTDIRDRLGFAVRELYVGSTGADGQFHDAIHHAPKASTQSFVVTSSSDPWHRAVDRDDELEQPGIDLLYKSGLTQGLPMMIPVGAVYDTPDNAAALIRYVKSKHYPVMGVELGEEPDGQLMSGIDYADLYIQAADAVHSADPSLRLGGPSLQDAIADAYMEDEADKSFTSQFVKRLDARGRLKDLNFFTFERYPFDDTCPSAGSLLIKQGEGMDQLMARLDRDGVPRSVDWIITEYGFSAFGGRVEVEVPSALMNADIAAGFLSRGGKAAYMFGYGPNIPLAAPKPCGGYGTMMLQQADSKGQARDNMPAFWGAQMLSQDWLQSGHGAHVLYPVTTDIHDAKGQPLVTAYAVKRPDGRMAVMIVNRDPDHAHNIHIRLAGAKRGLKAAMVYQYYPALYKWHPNGDIGRVVRDFAPVKRQVSAGAAIRLPAMSLTVVRAKP